MHLEICYDGDVLLELPLEQIGNATNLQPILERLFDQFDEKFGLSGSYDDPGEWVTELEITAIYND